VSNQTGTQAWAAAACPRPSVLSTRGTASPSPLYASPEAGRVRRNDVEKPVEQHVFTKLAAVQAKDAGIRMPLGPPPWRPPE
jgi:hypothetical protein